MAGVSEITLDLHAIVDKLRLFESDLEAYYWDRAGNGALPERERYQIALWMRQVSERGTALGDVVMHLGYPTVVVTVSTAARETLRCAVDLFDRSVDEGAPFDGVLRSVAAMLSAADIICLRAAGGRPDSAARCDVGLERIAPISASRSGIVLARIAPNRPLRGPEVEKNDQPPTRNVGS